MRWLLPLLLLSLTLHGQQLPAPAGFTGGVEADALPFLTGGYYMSVWGGYRHIRYRIILADVNTPHFLLSDKFSRNEIEAYALIADYFFRRGFTGAWIGTGVEWWKGQIDANDGSAKGNYTNYMYTMGGGYVWNVYRGFYINPWAGGHLKIGGDRSVQVGDQDFVPPLLTPEISLKIGWHF